MNEFYKGGNLRMYDREEVAELLGTHKDTISMLYEIGCLKGIKIGKKIMFSYDAIARFQLVYEGLDLSNRLKAIESFKLVNAKS